MPPESGLADDAVAHRAGRLAVEQVGVEPAAALLVGRLVERQPELVEGERVGVLVPERVPDDEVVVAATEEAMVVARRDETGDVDLLQEGARRPSGRHRRIRRGRPPRARLAAFRRWPRRLSGSRRSPGVDPPSPPSAASISLSCSWTGSAAATLAPRNVLVTTATAVISLERIGNLSSLVVGHSTRRASGPGDPGPVLRTRESNRAGRPA